jgi:hypothetical protein
MSSRSLVSTKVDDLSSRQIRTQAFAVGNWTSLQTSRAIRYGGGDLRRRGRNSIVHDLDSTIEGFYASATVDMRLAEAMRGTDQILDQKMLLGGVAP